MDSIEVTLQASGFRLQASGFRYCIRDDARSICGST
jgi:hypothetical protein